ncbi:MAG TPA: metal-dependent hydrolase, partial [Lysobacter sp.]|nr:metal-dependent hydrolase [Lysobacter sp.]
IWWWFRRRGGRVAQSPTRWWWAIFACLMAHPLLDGFTVYGTQLLWPLPVRPIMWSSLFIIDPLFTLPWFLAFAVAWFAREKPLAQRALVAGIGLGVAYLGWSLFAKAMVEREADRALAMSGLADAPRFSVPAPLTTLRWRVVAMTPDGFVEGERALSDAGPMRFHAYRSDVAALEAARGIPAVERLLWFDHGFAKAEVRDGVLALSDLRMGSEPDYAFRFAVAEREGPGWRPIPPVDVDRQQTAQALKRLWKHWRGGDIEPAGDARATGAAH